MNPAKENLNNVCHLYAPNRTAADNHENVTTILEYWKIIDIFFWSLEMKAEKKPGKNFVLC